MQDRIRVKKIVKTVVEKASQVKDALKIDTLFEQAKAQVKRWHEKDKERQKNRNRER